MDNIDHSTWKHIVALQLMILAKNKLRRKIELNVLEKLGENLEHLNITEQKRLELLALVIVICRRKTTDRGEYLSQLVDYIESI